MAWTLKVFGPTTTVAGTPLATYSDTSPGGIVGPITWRNRADGDCVDMTFKAIQSLTPIDHRQVVLLTVDGVNVFAGLIVQRPGNGDLSGNYVATGMRELLNNTTMAVTKYAGTTDIANIVKSVLNNYKHSAVIYDSTLVISSTGVTVTEYDLPIVTVGALLDAFVASSNGVTWGVNADGKAFFKVASGTDTFNANNAAVDYDPTDSTGMVRGVIGVAANANAVGTIRIYNISNPVFTTFSAGDFGTYGTSQSVMIPPELLAYYPAYRTTGTATTANSSISGIINSSAEASWTSGPTIYSATALANLSDNDMTTTATGLWTIPADSIRSVATIFRAPVGVIPFAFEVVLSAAPANTGLNFDSVPPGVGDISFTFGNYGLSETVGAIRHGTVYSDVPNQVFSFRYVFGWPGIANINRSSDASNHWRARITAQNSTASGSLTYYTARFIGIANSAWVGYCGRLFPGLVTTPLRATRNGYIAPLPNVSISNVPNVGTVATKAEGYEYALDNYGMTTAVTLARMADLDAQAVSRLVTTGINSNQVSGFNAIITGGN